MKIGIIKEGKTPVDHRVPFTPTQAAQIQKEFGHEVVVQPSNVRAIKDEEYVEAGLKLQEDLTDCDILFGVKEVPKEWLIPGKTYFFFSHTIKMQPYNKTLLQEVMKKKVTLADYECLKNDSDQRVVAFGRWAGIVGGYNAFLTFGLKYKAFELKPAHACFDLNELKEELKKVDLPDLKICLTGGGRVSKGSMEILDALEIRKVSVDEYLNNEFEEPVYTQLDSEEYNRRADGSSFDYAHFYKNPKLYQGNFERFLPHTDMLIAGAYWDPEAPVLFSIEDLKKDDFRIRVVADITCDIQGSVPTTLRPSTIADPHYDISLEGKEEVAFSNDDNVSVMAVDNLPCELPRDASEDFGSQLMAAVIPEFSSEDKPIVSGASLTNSEGELTEGYKYLTDYVK